jgi:outer membrane protein
VTVSRFRVSRTIALALLACTAGAPAAAQGLEAQALEVQALVAQVQDPQVQPAADAGPPMELSLEAAVQRAVALSEEVETVRAQQAGAEGQIAQARAGALPQLTASAGYTRTLASIFQGINLPFPGFGEGEDGDNPFAALPFGRPNIWMATMQVRQPLYAAGRVRTALDIARNVRRATALEIDEAEADIALQVRSAYFRLGLADEFVAIAQEAYGLADAQFRQVELFRQQGTASDFDLLRARVERDNLEPPIIEARNARRLAELDLKRLINVPAAQPLRITTRLDPLIEDVDREALRAAIPQRAGLRAFDEVIAAREGAVRIAQAAKRPSVDFLGTFAFQAFPNQPAPPIRDWRRDWAVSVNVTLPVLDGGRSAGEVQQARADLQQARLQRAQVREGLEIELEAALAEFEASRAQIAARRATVDQARRATELAELRFRSGLATQLEISDARLLLRQSQLNETQALSAYLTTLARLERASGGEIPLVTSRLAGAR